MRSITSSFKDIFPFSMQMIKDGSIIFVDGGENTVKKISFKDSLSKIQVDMSLIAQKAIKRQHNEILSVRMTNSSFFCI